MPICIGPINSNCLLSSAKKPQNPQHKKHKSTALLESSTNGFFIQLQLLGDTRSGQQHMLFCQMALLRFMIT